MTDTPLAPADLASTPAQKKKAANAIEQHLEPDTARDGKAAEESTDAAVKEFGANDGKGWDTSRALKKAHETWEKQVKALGGRLGSEKAALRQTTTLFTHQDIGIANAVRASSAFDSY
ncbi:hypothetical protein ACIBI4_33490 [Streptomyces sp. NPDC050418]|uniref:hypothetical protein n=1 Tax=Streptomyces sp. NPDC050418 TaxID=3365612 RepID=UPI0037BC2452